MVIAAREARPAQIRMCRRGRGRRLTAVIREVDMTLPVPGPPYNSVHVSTWPPVQVVMMKAVMAAGSAHDYAGLTARTGQSAPKRMSWALDPKMSLPTGERRRMPMTIMSTSSSAAKLNRSSPGAFPRTSSLI